MHFSSKSLEINGAAAENNKALCLDALGLLAVCLLPFALAWDSARATSTLISANDSFSQILVIPFVSVFFIYEGRKRIFSAVYSAWLLGTALIVPGLLLVFAAHLNVWELRPSNQGALFVFGVVLVWLGGFAFFFGPQAFWAARFPLLFLLSSVPIPEPIHSDIVAFLQKASADAAELFFRLAGVPYFREDLIFNLPGLSIRVADECSGIRSSLALLITTVLASYVFLRSPWKRLLLCAVVVPLAVLKNGLRIATLSTLAIYVNPDFLSGTLHRRGGIVFFLVALVPITVLLKYLQKSEQARVYSAKRRDSARNQNDIS